MELNTKYDIGQVIYLFGFHDWPCIVSAITVRASGQVEYLLEWNCEGEAKSEWFEEKRIELLAELMKKHKENSNGKKVL